jgi:hypothetical protein
VRALVATARSKTRRPSGSGSRGDLGRTYTPTREVRLVSEPVVFISHFVVKEGALDELKRLTGDAMERIRQGKRRTVLFLSYLDEQAAGSRSCTPSPTPTRWTSTSRVPTSGLPRRMSSSSPEAGSSTGSRASRRWRACERPRRVRRPAGRRTGVQRRVPPPRAAPTRTPRQATARGPTSRGGRRGSCPRCGRVRGSPRATSMPTSLLHCTHRRLSSTPHIGWICSFSTRSEIADAKTGLLSGAHSA